MEMNEMKSTGRGLSLNRNVSLGGWKNEGRCRFSEWKRVESLERL